MDVRISRTRNVSYSNYALILNVSVISPPFYAVCSMLNSEAIVEGFVSFVFSLIFMEIWVSLGYV